MHDVDRCESCLIDPETGDLETCEEGRQMEDRAEPVFVVLGDGLAFTAFLKEGTIKRIVTISRKEGKSIPEVIALSLQQTSDQGETDIVTVPVAMP